MSMIDKNDNDKTDGITFRFKKAYQNARHGMHKQELEFNRKQIIVISDHGRKISRPYRWDH